MKSFNQFLKENNLNEEPAGRPMKKRPPGGPSYKELQAQIFAKDDAKDARAAQRGPTGAAADTTKQFRPQGTTTNVSGPDVRGPEGPTPPTSSPSPSSPVTGRRSRVNGRVVPGVDTRQLPKPATPTASTPPKPTGTPVRSSIGNVSGPATSPKKPSAPSPGPGPGGGPAGGPGPGPSGGPKSPVPPSDGPIAPSKPKLKIPTGAKNALRVGGKLIGPASAALDVADERSKGSGWLRSLAKGATVAAGGALGGAAGTAAGPVGTVVGAGAGSMAASKAFDTAAGANAVERKAIATANRKSQAGGALKGVGGKTSFDTKKNTITSGGKTAQLGKTSVITGPGGKQELGNLAYKNGKAVYKRSDTKSLAQTSSNPFERVGRTFDKILKLKNYEKSDAANAAKKLATARQSDAARNKALGVKFGPGK